MTAGGELLDVAGEEGSYSSWCLVSPPDVIGMLEDISLKEGQNMLAGKGQ